MNKLWTYLMILSIAALVFVQPQSVISEMTNASMDVINLCITLLAVYTVWLGILEIVDATGLGARLARLLRPLIRKLFKINDPETEKYIALNMSSNILGLGNASTPMGIKAMNRDQAYTAPANRLTAGKGDGGIVGMELAVSFFVGLLY
ncbi:MAG: hypothetical protein IJ975_01160, partial [Clostridia bacterium]|nr:hypothetical protein [Clostridia bacterium]